MLTLVVPLLVLLMGTFMRAFGYFNIPRPWTIGKLAAGTCRSEPIESLWNTLIVGLGTALNGAAFYALVAYVVVRTDLFFKGRAILDFILISILVCPGHPDMTGAFVDGFRNEKYLVRRARFTRS